MMIPALARDDGAIAVFAAVVLPLLLAFAGFGLGSLLLTGGERELQRSADAAALATAASLPLADLTGSHLAGALATGCTTARANLDQARVTRGFAVGDSPDCDNGGVVITPESELGELMDLEGEIAAIHEELEDALLVSVTSTVEVCTEVTLLGETVEVCEDVTVTTDEPLSVPVDLGPLLPALLTPRVRVTAEHTLTTPLGELVGEGLGSNDVAAAALARRRIKNAVLLPTQACPGLEASLEAQVGTSWTKAELYAAVETHCDLGDPNTYAAAAFTALYDVADRLAELLPGAGDLPACLLDGLDQDLLDLYDPPQGGHVPTAGDIIAAARSTDEDVIVVLAGVVGATQIPVLDVFAAPAASLAEGEIVGTVTDLPAARGAFRASLLDHTAPGRILECLS